MNCLIVDDEPVARQGLQNYLSRIPEASIVSIHNNVTGLPESISINKPDLILLDIHMPGVSGIDFLKSNKQLPPVIIITAYPEHALEGYELDLVDYLLKPVSFDRFLKSFQKAQKLIRHGYSTAGRENDYLFIRSGNRFEKLNFTDIIYIESMLNYIKIYTAAKVHITYSSLKGIEQELPKDKFLKIHKSYIIALSKITSLQGNEITVQSIKLPISRSLKNEVYRLLLSGKKLGQCMF